MKYAYFVSPHIGGTYSVFRHLRKGLGAYGVDVRWMGIGQQDFDAASRWFPDLAFGGYVRIGADVREAEQANLLLGAIEAGGYDGVFVNVLADRVQTNVARYLPEKIKRIMIVHNITPGTYAAAAAIREHVHATVGVSSRCREDLVRRYAFRPNRTFAIDNAVDTEVSTRMERFPARTPGLRLAYLGRVEDVSKGVFWLADIFKQLTTDATLTIAGDGPDLERLKVRLAPFGDRVHFHGFVAPEEVPALLCRHDVLVMPSRFEGFGLTIIEAMAAGCVPVVSRIAGVTDTIVEHGVNGFLFPVGNSRLAARSVDGLGDPETWRRMSDAARRRAGNAFTIAQMAERYRKVIDLVQHNDVLPTAPLELGHWTMPKGLRSGFRTYLPGPVKNWLREIRERL
ncbi:MAG: glycosyltransferase family 4 protein [Shinella sp.]|nr:glycosyltransferase family 4 protein [Shinella sp.]